MASRVAEKRPPAQTVAGSRPALADFLPVSAKEKLRRERGRGLERGVRKANISILKHLPMICEK